MTTPEIRPSIGSWRLARGLFPIYFELAPPELAPPFPPDELHNRGDAGLRAALAWFDQVDARLKPAEFRGRLRAAAGSDWGDALELVLERLLASGSRVAEQVQKVDEACFDYFCLHA